MHFFPTYKALCCAPKYYFFYLFSVESQTKLMAQFKHQSFNEPVGVLIDGFPTQYSKPGPPIMPSAKFN